MPKKGELTKGAWHCCSVCRKKFWRCQSWIKKSGPGKTCSWSCRKRHISNLFGNEKVVIDEYVSGLSLDALSKKYKADANTIKHLLTEAGIAIRDRWFYVKGSKNKNWKGGHITQGGYRRVGKKLEHRIVIEALLGRKLTKSEHVHHLNGIKTDNRPDNLAVHSPKAHTTLHAQIFKTVQHMYFARIRSLEHELRLLRSKT